MKILVTGPGGFLARYIVEQLIARGDQVRGYARRPQPELTAMGVEMISGDIADTSAVVKACEGIDLVFHVAAISGIGETWQRYYRTNTLGTENILRGCVEQGVTRLVYTSSPSAVFGGKPQKGVNETIPYPDKWLGYYPHSKALGEQLVIKANGRMTESGQPLATCVLRPHLMWGPRDDALVPRLFARSRSGRLRRVGDGKNRVDIIYVENAATGHIQAADVLCAGGLNSAVAGKAYFLSQGQPVNCWDWIADLLALDGLPPVRKTMSFRTAYTIGAAYEFLWRFTKWTADPPMSRFLATQLAMDVYFDISAAKQDFGFDPKIDITEGMRRLKEYYHSQKEHYNSQKE